MNRDWKQEKQRCEARIALIEQTIDELETQRAEALASLVPERHKNAEELTGVIVKYKAALRSYQASLENINDVLGMQADRSAQEEEMAQLRAGLEKLLAEYESQLAAAGEGVAPASAPASASAPAPAPEGGAPR